MGRRNVVTGLLAALLLMAASLPAYAIGRIVYLGQDPTCHFNSHPEAVDLARNSVTWVGFNSDPAIVAVNVDTCDVAGLLSAAGFTNVTVVLAADLPSTDLSGFQVMYVPAFFNAATVSGFGAAVQGFVRAGGGLVVEGSQQDWSAYPFGLQVGPAFNFSDSETVTIVNPGHPVMTGLTDVGLSNWESSIHQDFATPGPAGFVTLTRDNTNTAVDIAFDRVATQSAAPALDGVGSVLLVLVLFGTGMLGLRRRQAGSAR